MRNGRLGEQSHSTRKAFVASGGLPLGIQKVCDCLFPHERCWLKPVHSQAALSNHTARSTFHKRDGVIPGVPGTIDVISPVYNSTTVRRLASLVLSADDSDPNSFVLDASNSSQTQVYLVPLSDTPTDDTTGALAVELHVPIFSKENAKMLSYCATFDPKPASLSPLTAQPCVDTKTEHVAQQFQYISTTGVIKPLWPSDDTEMNSEGRPTPILPQNIPAAALNSSLSSSPQAVETNSGGMTLLAKADAGRNAIKTVGTGGPVNGTLLAGVHTTSDHPITSSTKQQTSNKLVLVFTPSSAASILSSPNSTSSDAKGKPRMRRTPLADGEDPPKDRRKLVETSIRISKASSGVLLHPRSRFARERNVKTGKRDTVALPASLIPVDPAPPYQWMFIPKNKRS
jgi:hypothetical protein